VDETLEFAERADVDGNNNPRRSRGSAIGGSNEVGGGTAEGSVAGGDDDQTVIGASGEDAFDAFFSEERGGGVGAPWSSSEEEDALRRDAMRREVERVQRTNFAHFLLLCLIPTSLLLIVLASVLGDNGGCVGGPVSCVNEPRMFVNAFTTRCICDAVEILGGS